jgi:hypothetical protein
VEKGDISGIHHPDVRPFPKTVPISGNIRRRAIFLTKKWKKEYN